MSSEPLKLLYVCADRGISLGGSKGASVHIREFASAFIAAGHRVTVLTRENGKENRRYSFPVHSLSQEKINPNETVRGTNSAEEKAGDDWDEYRKNASIEKSLEAVGLKAAFDVVYERYSLFSIAGLNYAKAAGLPFILEVNAPLVVEAERYRKLRSPQLARDVELHLFSSAEHIIAVSWPIKEYILRIAPKANVTVVPNGVNVERFAPVDALRTEGRIFTVGFVGNLRPWHGVDNLIQAFSILLKSDRNCRLLMVGDTRKMKNDIERLCQENRIEGAVEFTGAVPLEDIPSLLHEIDVATAPYPRLPDFYFSSLKLFEYMAAGKAIVASKIGQIEEILDHDKTALLVPPGNIEALSGALTRLKNDREFRLALGRNARVEAVSHHTWGHRIQVLARIIESCRKKMEYR